METQRQKADLSILRTTPALLSWFSLVTLLANVQAQKDNLPVQCTAWMLRNCQPFRMHFPQSSKLRSGKSFFELRQFMAKFEKYRQHAQNFVPL